MEMPQRVSSKRVNPSLNGHELMDSVASVVLSHPDEAKRGCLAILADSMLTEQVHSEATDQLVALFVIDDNGGFAGFSARKYLGFIGAHKLSLDEKQVLQQRHEALANYYEGKHRAILAENHKPFSFSELGEKFTRLFESSNSNLLPESTGLSERHAEALVQVHLRIASRLGSAESSWKLSERYFDRLRSMIEWDLIDIAAFKEDVKESSKSEDGRDFEIFNLTEHYAKKAQAQGMKNALFSCGRKAANVIRCDGNGLFKLSGMRQLREDCFQLAANLGDSKAASELAKIHYSNHNNNPKTINELVQVVVLNGTTKDKLEFGEWYLTRSGCPDANEIKMATTLLGSSSDLNADVLKPYNKMWGLYKKILAEKPKNEMRVINNEL